MPAAAAVLAALPDRLRDPHAEYVQCASDEAAYRLAALHTTQWYPDDLDEQAELTAECDRLGRVRRGMLDRVRDAFEVLNMDAGEELGCMIVTYPVRHADGSRETRAASKLWPYLGSDETDDLMNVWDYEAGACSIPLTFGAFEQECSRYLAQLGQED